MKVLIEARCVHSRLGARFESKIQLERVLGSEIES
jgi:hypothetical protein